MKNINNILLHINRCCTALSNFILLWFVVAVSEYLDSSGVSGIRV